MKKFVLTILAVLAFPTSPVFSQSVADSLLNDLKRPLSDTSRIKTLIKLSKQDAISKDSTLAFVNESVRLAEAIKSNEWIANSRVALGLWHLDKDKNPDTALVIWHRMREQMEKANYLRGRALAYRYLGKVFLFNASDSAIYYNIKSMDLFKELKDSNMVNSIKINLAVVYAQTKREVEAIQLTKEGMEYASSHNNLLDAGSAAVNVGYFYEWISNYDSAEVYFKKSMEFNSRRGDPVGVGHAKVKLADILFLKKQYEKALAIYKEVLDTGKNLKSDRLLNYGYNGIAAVALVFKKWDEAIQNFNAAYSFSGKNNSEKVKFYQNLYTAYEGKRDFKKALEYHKLYIEIRDTFNNAERLQKVDALEARYQNNEKRNEIELLNKEKEIQQASMQRQQLIRNAIILISVVLLVVGGLLFNRFKLKKQIENQQAIINERKRISRELHDDLGAQLSTAKMFLSSIKVKEESDENESLVKTSLNLIDGSIHDLRKIMNDLHVSTLQEKGYLLATEELINKINELQQLNFVLSHTGIPTRMEQKVEHNLFRITQELVNNALKYAKATTVTIDLLIRNGTVILMYEDNGIGFNPDQLHAGYGLKNMGFRAASIGGKIVWDSTPGNGCRCSVELPLT